MDRDRLFEFKMTDWGAWLIDYKAKDDPTVTDVEIPPEYGGAAVTEVSCGAFREAKHLRTVYVPDSVKRVMGCAFAGCVSLVSARLPVEVYQMASYVFWNCAALKEVTLPKNLKEIPVSCFLNCSSLERIEIPEEVETIETCAFSECSSLKEISLPKSVRVVQAGAFEKCAKLERVEFGNPMTAMIRDAFEGCARLSEETRLMAALCTADPNVGLRERINGGYNIDYQSILGELFRTALLLGKFERCDTAELVRRMIGLDILPSLELAAEYGWITAAAIDGFIDCASAEKRTEIAAWLLDYKNAHLGFDGGSGLEL